jgi:cyclophilin family peptidyl-prolyl cis-trans isomerase
MRKLLFRKLLFRKLLFGILSLFIVGPSFTWAEQTPSLFTNKHPIVLLETSMGNIFSKLYPNRVGPSFIWAEQTPSLFTNKYPIVLLETSMGNIFFKLYPNRAPKTCENFLTYVTNNYYTKTLFHRVIDGFIVQGGGFKQGFVQTHTYKPIKNESKKGLPNLRGWVGMVLTTNAHSAASQFYINVVNNPDSDYSIRRGYGYTVFAKVIDGMDVVDRIKKLKTRRITIYSTLYKRDIPLYNVPEKEVIIYRAVQIR